MSANTSPGLDTYATFFFLGKRFTRRDSFVPSGGHRRHPSIWPPTLALVGHLAATTFVFISLFTLGWIASVLFSYLHAIHRFSEDAFEVFVKLEIALIYLDAFVCGIAFLFGIGRYIRTLVEKL